MLRVTNADFICLRNVSDPVSRTDSELLYHTLDPSGVFGIRIVGMLTVVVVEVFTS
jgi:hypothetical protein